MTVSYRKIIRLSLMAGVLSTAACAETETTTPETSTADGASLAQPLGEGSAAPAASVPAASVQTAAANVNAAPASATEAKDPHGYAELASVSVNEDIFSDLGFEAEEGGEIYATVCAGCHMADGSGAVGGGEYPALKGNGNLTFPQYPISMTLNGRKGMPGLGPFLSDEQVVSLINYLQEDMNGFEPTATIEMVQAARTDFSRYVRGDMVDSQPGIVMVAELAADGEQAAASVMSDAQQEAPEAAPAEIPAPAEEPETEPAPAAAAEAPAASEAETPATAEAAPAETAPAAPEAETTAPAQAAAPAEAAPAPTTSEPAATAEAPAATPAEEAPTEEAAPAPATAAAPQAAPETPPAAPSAALAEAAVRHKNPGSNFPILMAAEIPATSSMVYLSGTVPQVINTEAPRNSLEAFGDTKAQTESTLKSIDQKLKSLGLTMSDVIKMQVFLVRPEGADAMDFSGFMEGYTQFFATDEQPNMPTRSVLEVAGLANPNWLVEIEVVAVKPGEAASAPAENAAPEAMAEKVVRHKIPGSDFPILMAAEIPATTQLVYLSGTVPQVVNEEAPRNSMEAFGDTKAQTVSTLQSIEAKLKSLDLSMGDVVKMQVFLVRPEGADAMDFAGFMEGYTQFFGTDEQPNTPTRSVFEVAGLANKNWLVEIEVAATR